MISWNITRSTDKGGIVCSVGEESLSLTLLRIPGIWGNKKQTNFSFKSVCLLFLTSRGSVLFIACTRVDCAHWTALGTPVGQQFEKRIFCFVLNCWSLWFTEHLLRTKMLIFNCCVEFSNKHALICIWTKCTKIFLS